MRPYESFDAILSIRNNSPRDDRVDSGKRSVKSDFFNSPSYYQVSAYIPSTPLSSTPLDVWITDNSKLKSQKNIDAYPGQLLKSGYLIHWDTLDQYWLVIQNDDQVGDMYDRGIAQRCYSSIKWLDSTGTIREAWFCEPQSSESNFGVQDGRVLIMPNERRHIVVQRNQYTDEIHKDQRFIFDDRAWRTISINRIATDGTIQIVVEENLINTATDNVNLRIADYYENLHVKAIEVLNGTSFNINLGSTVQLNVQVKDNGNVVSEPVTYSSGDTSIATVDTNGLVTGVGNGIVVISVTLSSDATVHKDIAVNVESVVGNNYILNLIGADSVKVSQPQTYTANVTNNGVVDTSKTVAWSLFADDGVSSTALASIGCQTETSCVVSAIKPASTVSASYVRLKAVCVQDGSIVNDKRILIKGIF